MVEGQTVRSRMLSPREAARLMGLSDDYRLPQRYNDAYHVLVDGSACRWPAARGQRFFQPLLRVNGASGLVAAPNRPSCRRGASANCVLRTAGVDVTTRGAPVGAICSITEASVRRLSASTGVTLPAISIASRGQISPWWRNTAETRIKCLINSGSLRS